jgi:precorrin-6B methylase 2
MFPKIMLIVLNVIKKKALMWFLFSINQKFNRFEITEENKKRLLQEKLTVISKKAKKCKNQIKKRYK